MKIVVYHEEYLISLIDNKQPSNICNLHKENNLSICKHCKKLICQKCSKMPFIKICYIDEGKIIISIKCKCGKKFDDLTISIRDDYFSGLKVWHIVLICIIAAAVVAVVVYFIVKYLWLYQRR